ncbi:MAG: hypothetical protein JSR45_12475 [Proteobacteria bacterium]|nr:hypothetical protein [Pseudomonadota bacterium]
MTRSQFRALLSVAALFALCACDKREHVGGYQEFRLNFSGKGRVIVTCDKFEIAKVLSCQLRNGTPGEVIIYAVRGTQDAAYRQASALDVAPSEISNPSESVATHYFQVDGNTGLWILKRPIDTKGHLQMMLSLCSNIVRGGALGGRKDIVEYNEAVFAQIGDLYPKYKSESWKTTVDVLSRDFLYTSIPAGAQFRATDGCTLTEIPS